MVAEIRAPVPVDGPASADKPDYSRGSGYLVGGGLVLTAAHVVFDDYGRKLPVVEVRGIVAGGWRKATVIWPSAYPRGEDGGDVADVALVRLEQGAGLAGEVTPVGWGWLTGQQPVKDCLLVGFPRLGRDEETLLRQPEQAEGTISPVGGSRSDQLYFQVDGPIPAWWPGSDSPWAGVSGAAVFAGGLLVGVVASDHQTFGGGRLSATRISAIAGAAEFARLVSGIDRLELKSVELAGLFDDPAQVGDRRSPTSLLRPGRTVVGFYGRDSWIGDLTGWCVKESAPWAVRLITGPGGQGKTRLALELCDDLSAAGWVSGFLARSILAGLLEKIVETDTPVLLIVDYAEARARHLSALFRVLQQRTPAKRVRILLLARSAHDEADWWWQIRDELRDKLDNRLVPEPLTDLEPRQDDRSGSYQRALTDLARAWSQVDTEADWTALATTMAIPADLDDPRYTLALALHERALAALLQAGPNPITALPADTENTDILLAHEGRYWAETADAPPHHLSRKYIWRLRHQAVVAAALCGATSEEEAIATLRRLPHLKDQNSADLAMLAAWLRDLYPSPPNAYWGSLVPDRIAEHLIGQALRARSDGGEPGLARALLGGATPRQLRDSLMILARASAHQPYLPDLITKLIIIDKQVAPAVAQLHFTALAAVLDAFPQRSVALADAADTLIALAETQAREAAKSRRDQATLEALARLLTSLSTRQSSLDQRQRPIAVDAAALHRELAAYQPTAEREAPWR
ncbi:serine protease [Frankia sp. AiPs1]|uniref:S1 family peptidase n=1 Tax=Frankia sp. AiPs1 TaxID=573493 RepID=UPI002042CAA4|nr:serine protease [Frankia sp. AiPs1]MCM3920146.1 serine protease [Frankia sp. AiPs1]